MLSPFECLVSQLHSTRDLQTMSLFLSHFLFCETYCTLSLKNYANKYGLDKKVVYPHSFRHRYAKNFLEKYNDIALLADLMGHESIETTRIYLRRTASEQQALVDKIVTW